MTLLLAIIALVLAGCGGPPEPTPRLQPDAGQQRAQVPAAAPSQPGAGAASPNYGNVPAPTSRCQQAACVGPEFRNPNQAVIRPIRVH